MRGHRWTLCVAIGGVAFASALCFAACDSRDGGNPRGNGTVAGDEPAPLDPSTIACLEAGNSCALWTGAKNAFGCQGKVDVGPCGPEARCCQDYSGACGESLCTSGNTCDSNVMGYCSGATSTPNCGAMACTGYCTCSETRCNCPPCQRVPHPSNVGQLDCPNGLHLYSCYNAGYYDAGPLAPLEAGTCIPQTSLGAPTGNLCCEY
ncbi:MAG: hypothetical protein ACRELY_32645 [Polyangiaceae bacterium]